MEKPRSVERERLETANRQIVDAQERIARQRGVVAEMEAQGRESARSTQFLSVLQDVHSQLLVVRRAALYDLIEKKRRTRRPTGNDS